MATTIADRGWNADAIARIFGWVFLAAGVLGFFPNPLVSYRGLFEVNTLHNLVHIVSGGALLAAPYYNLSVSIMRIIGVVYAIVMVLGFISTDMMSWLAINQPDNWLHLILAGGLLWAGFSMTEDRERITTAH
ncbi:MAG: hypothetical protein CTY15_10505 [Methylocystis sp.]|nr:MAG: hypothetical protein CTY15_10505 [Methylocystis sp.]